jgi:tetratricopeptide (TPR) repeat protein
MARVSSRPSPRRGTAFLLFLGLSAALWADASGPFAEGERLFRENKPSEAAAVLETAVLDPGVDERAWLYLAASYEQQKRYDEALGVLRKGLPQASRYRHLFYFDMGNLFALQGKNAFAEEMYGEAVKAEDGYAPAYLNRANVRMALKEYEGASADYRLYLAREPGSSQRSSIERLLDLLGADLAAAQKAAAEAEAQRLAAEEAKKALLDQVGASLKASAEETTSLSAGSGDVQGYEDSLELEP